MKNLEHLKLVRENYLDLMKIKKSKFYNTEENRYKYYYSGMMGSFRTQAVAAYCLDNDLANFKKLIRESANMRYLLIEGYDNNKPVNYSRVTMLVYVDLLRALASGDMEFSEQFAKKMGGRGKIDTRVHAFDYKLGYCLKYLVLNEKDQAFEWLEKFEDQCTKRGFKSYTGFAKILRGILEEDSALAQQGFDEFKKAYKTLIRDGSTNAHSEWLNLWGIGIANLAISRGLKLNIEDEYIPKDLLIEK